MFVLIAQYSFFFLPKFNAYRILLDSWSGTRLVVSLRGDESYKELEILKDIDATMILHDLPFNEDKIGRVQAARR